MTHVVETNHVHHAATANPIDRSGPMKQVKDPHIWYAMVIKAFGDTKPAARLEWADVEYVALRNHVKIPGWVRANVSGKGQNKVWNNVPATSIDAKPREIGSESNRDYFIKVTPRDRDTNKFLSVRDDEEGMRMTAMMNAALHAPVENPTAQDEKDPDKMFSDMSDLVKLVCRGVSPSLVIYGGGGIGKSFVAGQALTSEELEKDADYFVVKGKITPASLYQTLYRHRNDNTILVFDDADSVWSKANEDAANILKAALDSYPVREISWDTNRTKNVDKWSEEKRANYEARLDLQLEADGDEEETPIIEYDDNGKEIKAKKEEVLKMPAKFKYNGRIIFISNLPRDKFDEAVLTRGYKIDMDMSPNQIFKRMESLIEVIEPKITDAEMKRNVLKTIKAKYNVGKLGRPNMRMLESAIRMANTGMPNWSDLIEYA